MKIILLGPQGSGKGVQGELIEKRLGIKHIVMGDLLRGEASKKTELGKKIKKILDRGGLVSDDMTNKIIQGEIRGKKSFVLDGYPRTKSQAEFLSKITDIDYIIYLKVDDVVVMKRISGRRICSKGHVFNINTMPPKIKGICDIDGLKLVQRRDDREEAIKRRLKIFHKQTAQLLEYYADRLLIVDGSLSPEEVYSQILEGLRIS